MATEAEQRFIQAWRYAAPELESIRRRELLELDETAGLRMIGAPAPSERPENGLIVFQAWMMRLRVVQLMQQLSQHQTPSQAGE